MPEAINVPVGAGGIPALPPGAQVSERQPANAQPGFVVPPIPAQAVPSAPAQPAAGTYTQAQVDAAVAAALAGKVAAPTAIPQNPSAAISTGSNASDPVLSAYEASFEAMATTAGIDLERVLGRALAYGDPALIDTAYLNEKGGAAAGNLAVIAKAIVTRVQEQARATEQAAFSAAGNEAGWRAAAGVFDKSAPAHTKLVVKQMLDSGDPAAVAAAAKTVVEFANASGQVVVRPGLVDAGAGTGDAGQGLSKEAFQKAHAALNPNARDYLQQKDQLFKQRSLGKSLGM